MSSACDKFEPQAFRKKMCATCFLPEDQHGAARGAHCIRQRNKQ